MRELIEETRQNFTFNDLLGDILKETKLSKSKNSKPDSKVLERESLQSMKEILLTQQIIKTSETEVYEGDSKEMSLEVQKNAKWQRNQIKIQEVILTFLTVKKRLPTNTEIAHFAGVTRQTVHTHLKEESSKTIFKQEMNKLWMLSSVIISKLIELALKDDVRALKLLINLMQSKTGVESSLQNNFILINNTRIDNFVLNKLSCSALAEIESIINREVQFE